MNVTISDRVLAIAIALLAFCSFAWLSPQWEKNDQIVTRLALTLAIVERGELTIDPFAGRTVDKALFDGRYYTDKAPGHSLLAVPVVAVARFALGALGLSTDSTDPETFARYSALATIGTNGILSAIAAGLLFLTALRLEASRMGAAFGTIAFVLGSPFFGWSTAFFAHSASASLLVLVFAMIAAAFAGERRILPGRPVALGLLIGVLIGFTLVVDLTTAPMLALAGALVPILARWQKGSGIVRLGAALLVGGALGLAPLLIYNQVAFGSPFTLGYSEVVGFTGMEQGLFGITWPSLGVLQEILIGDYRGLLPLSPILGLAPFGLYRMFARPPTRLAGAVIVVAAIVFLWINSAYVYWQGGNSTGPRHLVPLLPFLGLALCFAWPPRGWLRIGALLVLALSLVVSAIAASVDMFAPESIPQPMRDYILPGFQGWAQFQALSLLAVWAALALLVFGLSRPWTKSVAASAPPVSAPQGGSQARTAPGDPPTAADI